MPKDTIYCSRNTTAWQQGGFKYSFCTMQLLVFQSEKGNQKQNNFLKAFLN